MKAASRRRSSRAMQPIHVYEICPRKDHRGVDLISDALPFGHLWYIELNATTEYLGGVIALFLFVCNSYKE